MISTWLKKTGVFLFTAMALTAVNAQQGVTPLNPPQPVENDGKVEVLEFFAYGCIHCANLEPSLEAWAKKQPADVKLKRIPSPVAIMGIDSTVIFYSLEALGQLDRLHAKIFEALHVDRIALGNPALLNKWLEKNGVDPQKYEEAQKSFSVVTKVRRANKMVEDYRINATPSIVVNGRYLLEQGVTGAAVLFANVDQLVAQTRAAMKTTAAPAVTPAAAKSDVKKAVATPAK